MLLSTSMVFASDWVSIGGTSTSDWYMDKESIAPIDGKMKAWFLVDYAEEQSNIFGKKFKSTKQLSYFDCQSQTSATVQSALFADNLGNGNTVDTYAANKKTLEYIDVMPDSIGEMALQAVCKSAPKKKK